MADHFAMLSTSVDDDCTDRVGIGLTRSGSALLRAENLQPLIVFGPQRSGKTTSVVIPAVLEWENPCLVTSVRLDVVAATLQRRSAMGEVFIFDPAGVVEEAGAGFAEYSVGWSPLDGISTMDDAARQAKSLTEGVDSSAMKHAEFWASQSRLLMTPLLFAAASTGGSMSDVLNWLGLIASDLIDEVIARRGPVPPDKKADWERCLRRLISFEGYHPETYSGVCAEAATALEAFAFSEVERRGANPHRLSLSKFFDGKPNTIFLCAPVNEQRMFMPLFTALARQVMWEAIRRNSKVDKLGAAIIDVQLMLCLDEAGNIAKLEDLDRFATTAAGSGIQLVSVFHDMSQLIAAYGEDRGALIVNNHRGKLFLPGNSDPRTSRYLTSLLGDTQVGGHSIYGWRAADLREMPREQAILMYDSLPPILLGLRRWNQDKRLRGMVGVDE